MHSFLRSIGFSEITKDIDIFPFLQMTIDSPDMRSSYKKPDGETFIELKKELLEKGEKLYKEGSVRNEELKRELKDKIKENVTVEVAPTTKEDVVELINNMTDEEKKEILKSFKS